MSFRKHPLQWRMRYATARDVCGYSLKTLCHFQQVLFFDVIQSFVEYDFTGFFRAVSPEYQDAFARK